MKKNLTYTQQKKKKTFDWNKFFAQDFSSDEKFSVKKSEELKEAAKLASNWTTCACGNQCAIIPRRNQGEPLDLDLSVLGLDFCSAVNEMYCSYFSAYGYSKSQGFKPTKTERNRILTYQNKAIKILGRIEKRSAFLINEILNK